MDMKSRIEEQRLRQIAVGLRKQAFEIEKIADMLMCKIDISSEEKNKLRSKAGYCEPRDFLLMETKK